MLSEATPYNTQIYRSINITDYNLILDPGETRYMNLDDRAFPRY